MTVFKTCFFVLSFALLVNSNGDYSLISMETLNLYNEKTLVNALKNGTSNLCNPLIDDAVIDCFGEGDVSQIKLNLFSKRGNVTLSLREMSLICDQYGYYNKHKHTLIIVTGFVSSESYDIKKKLSEITYCTDDYNVIHLDAAITIEMMYKLLRFNINMISYFTLKLIHALLKDGASHKDITLVGFSVAAHVVSHAAKLFSQQNHENLVLKTIYAIDPTPVCGKYDFYLNKNVAEQVIVFHGNNKFYGVKESLGCIDFYPNGECQIQPGCKSNVCSHMFPLWLFVESICYPQNILAQKCDNWDKFIDGGCYKNQVIGINMNIPENVSGKYFCQTSDEVPFGKKNDGIYFPRLMTRERVRKIINSQTNFNLK